MEGGALARPRVVVQNRGMSDGPTAPATITQTDLARKLGVTRRTVFRWLESGKLPSVILGGKRLILLSRLRAETTPLYEHLQQLE